MTTATYSPEDNKIRIYLSSRLSAEDYAPIKAAGYQYAPKQGCCYAVWSPEREDLALSLAGEITPEGTTLAERAAAKVERLEALANKAARRSTGFYEAANRLSEAFYMGQPILIGHHSERRARRTQERMQNLSRQSVHAAEAVDYWNTKATGVERHANMKNSDRTRINRIKTLMAELRDLQRSINDAYKTLEIWENAKPEDIEVLAGLYGTAPRYTEYKQNVLYRLEQKEITPEEAREICIKWCYSRIDNRSRQRCIMHTLNRLAYERGELGEVPRYEGALTPVILQAFLRDYGADKPKVSKDLAASCDAPLPPYISPDMSEALTLDAEGWRDLMQSLGYTVPDAKPSKAGTLAPLLNPSLEDAERLQALWNNGCTIQSESSEWFTKRSKTDAVGTVQLDAQGQIIGYRNKAAPVCRVRVYRINYMCRDSAVHLTDKPAKPLPISWGV